MAEMLEQLGLTNLENWPVSVAAVLVTILAILVGGLVNGFDVRRRLPAPRPQRKNSGVPEKQGATRRAMMVHVAQAGSQRLLADAEVLSRFPTGLELVIGIALGEGDRIEVSPAQLGIPPTWIEMEVVQSDQMEDGRWFVVASYVEMPSSIVRSLFAAV